MVFEGMISLTVSSMAERQFQKLDVTGSNPVPTTTLSAGNRRKQRFSSVRLDREAQGRRTIVEFSRTRFAARWFAVVWAAWKNTLQDADAAGTLVRQRRGNG